MKTSAPRKTARRILSMLFVLALFLAFFKTGESSALYTGQSAKENEIERLQAELEKLQTELERLKNDEDTSGRHQHNWTPATFTQPKTCSICGVTEGEPEPESTIPTESELEYMIQNSGYPTVSNKGVNLKLPDAKYYLSDPYRAKIKSSVRGGRIYVMPIPKSGNGNLGTIDDGTEVLIMARKGGYAFFVSYDGQMGWNGTGYFSN